MASLALVQELVLAVYGGSASIGIELFQGGSIYVQDGGVIRHQVYFKGGDLRSLPAMANSTAWEELQVALLEAGRQKASTLTSQLSTLEEVLKDG